MTRPVRLLAGILTVGAWTMLSRVLGFVRDIMIAAFLGSGPVAEAFFVAFRLPNLFRRVFAEGAFNMAFVPLFARRLEGDGPEAARRFGEDAMAALASALLALTLLAQAAMPWFVLALASGLEGERLDLTVAFSRVLFPYIVFISLAALFAGVLNSLGRFAAAAAAPVLLNAVLIAGMGLAALASWPIGPALVWSAALAGVLQLALTATAAARAGMGLRLRRPRLTPEVGRLFQLMLPAALTGGTVQINILVGTQVASYWPGAVGWLWYADRVYQLPLGVIGIAIGSVLLPELSRRLRASDAAGARSALNRAAEVALALTLPSTVALLVIPGLISAVLFERGAFGPADTAATALALAIYAAGLPAFVLQKIVAPAFFAREDTATPMRLAVIAMLVNLAVAIGAAPLVGWTAAPLATTLAAWVNLAMLWRAAGQLGPEVQPDAKLRARWPRQAAASLAMGALILAMIGAAEALWPGAEGAVRAGLLFGVVALAGLAYAGVSVAIGAADPADLAAALRRRRSA